MSELVSRSVKLCSAMLYCVLTFNISPLPSSMSLPNPNLCRQDSYDGRCPIYSPPTPPLPTHKWPWASSRYTEEGVRISSICAVSSMCAKTARGGGGGGPHRGASGLCRSTWGSSFSVLCCVVLIYSVNSSSVLSILYSLRFLAIFSFLISSFLLLIPPR